MRLSLKVIDTKLHEFKGWWKPVMAFPSNVYEAVRNDLSHLNSFKWPVSINFPLELIFFRMKVNKIKRISFGLQSCNEFLILMANWCGHKIPEIFQLQIRIKTI